MDPISYNLARRGVKRPSPPYSAIVCKDASTVWAEDAYGKTIAQGEAGVDDASVIQSALDSLTTGRTWKETVVIKGDFLVSATIKVPSYTKLIVHGKIKLSDSANANLLETDIGAADIEIIGGIYDGNKAKQSDGHALVFVRDATRAIIKNIYVTNGYKRGVEIDEGYDNIVDNVWIENCNRHGLMLWSSDPDRKLKHNIKTVITKNNGENGVDLGTVNTVGIYYIYSYGDKTSVGLAGCSNIQIGTVVSENATSKAISVDADYANCENIELQKLIILSSGARGLQIITFNDYNLKNLIIDTVIVDNPTEEGVFIGANAGNISDAQISKIIVRGAGSSTANKDAIVLQALTGYTLEEITINNVDCYDELGYQSYGMYISAGGTVSRVRVLGGRLHGALGALHTYGSPDFLVENVDGYVTKNSGSKTFSGDGTTTDFEIGAHGLVITDPSKIVVKVSPVSSDAINASPCVGYVDPADNTKIRVKFSSAPASGSNNVQIVWEAQVVS